MCGITYSYFTKKLHHNYVLYKVFNKWGNAYEQQGRQRLQMHTAMSCKGTHSWHPIPPHYIDLRSKFHLSSAVSVYSDQVVCHVLCVQHVFSVWQYYGCVPNTAASQYDHKCIKQIIKENNFQSKFDLLFQHSITRYMIHKKSISITYHNKSLVSFDIFHANSKIIIAAWNYFKK